jgi:hypothetical protein
MTVLTLVELALLKDFDSNLESFKLPPISLLLAATPERSIYQLQTTETRRHFFIVLIGIASQTVGLPVHFLWVHALNSFHIQ